MWNVFGVCLSTLALRFLLFHILLSLNAEIILPVQQLWWNSIAFYLIFWLLCALNQGCNCVFGSLRGLICFSSIHLLFQLFFQQSQWSWTRQRIICFWIYFFCCFCFCFIFFFLPCFHNTIWDFKNQFMQFFYLI